MDADRDSGIDVGGVVNPPVIVKIDPAGDVLLEVGTDPKLSLLVSSKVLSVTSEVFRALFNPHFEEGTKLAAKLVALDRYGVHSQTFVLTLSRNSGETYKLRLEDDDPAAMQKLCCLLHNQSEAQQRVSGTKISEFVEFAIVCDKYMCTDAVKVATLAWLAELQPAAGVEELQKLLVSTYFLDEPEKFLQISKQLAMDSKDSFLKLPTEENLYELLPFKIYGETVHPR